MPTNPTSQTAKDNTPLQDKVAYYALKYSTYGCVSNYQIRLEIALEENKYLTYKQVRNALYRLKKYIPIVHVGYGFYRLDGYYE